MKSASFKADMRHVPGRGRLRLMVFAVAVTVTVCLAGFWEFEEVDSGSLGNCVAIDRMSDGTLWLAYVSADSCIRLAHKDSTWVCKDLDTALVRPDFQSWPSFSFDVGPGDVIGVVGMGRLGVCRRTHHDRVRSRRFWSGKELAGVVSGSSAANC